jgi:hypothetical protein
VNTAGRVYILECSVGGINEYYVAYQWLDREGSPITNGSSISITYSTSASFLYFSPLHQSHEGNYTCNASTTAATESKSFYISVNGNNNIKILITEYYCPKLQYLQFMPKSVMKELHQ